MSFYASYTALSSFCYIIWAKYRLSRFPIYLKPRRPISAAVGHVFRLSGPRFWCCILNIKLFIYTKLFFSRVKRFNPTSINAFISGKERNLVKNVRNRRFKHWFCLWFDIDFFYFRVDWCLSSLRNSRSYSSPVNKLISRLISDLQW